MVMFAERSCLRELRELRLPNTNTLSRMALSSIRANTTGSSFLLSCGRHGAIRIAPKNKPDFQPQDFW